MQDKKSQINIRKANIEFMPDSSRVITRFFYPGDNHDRANKIIKRVLSLTDQKAEILYKEIYERFCDRHRDITTVFLNNYNHAVKNSMFNENPKETKKLLIGSYFTMEYSVASAALFNPSMVAHPNQSGLLKGDLRFILSFRAVGEGHISSILFGEGIIKQNGQIIVEQNTDFLDMGIISHCTENTYQLKFEDETPIISRVVFPVVEDEQMGLEDARFVKFENNTYYGTYTAYNGREIFPKLVETTDFKNFEITLLQGDGARNKGMALFPEKINGQYAMISRQDNENIFIMYSDDLYKWDNIEQIKNPEEPWEFIQLGNCGSPVKTDKGWLLLTHGVGAVRRYCMGAILLDPDNPSKVIASLKTPFLWPDEEERNGYVPNVVYSCGGLIHNEKLIVPYAVSDTSSKIAVLDLDELLGQMIAN